MLVVMRISRLYIVDSQVQVVEDKVNSNSKYIISVIAEPLAKRIAYEEDQDRLRSLWFNIYIPKQASKVT